jgi:hypothetical protein
MAKKKFIVEAICSVYLKGPGQSHGEFKIYRDFTVTGEYTNKANMGAELWEWAQSNWPEFTDKDITFEVEGVELTCPLRWVCVNGVKDMKGQPMAFWDTVFSRKKKRSKSKKATPSLQMKTTKAPPKKKAPPKPKTRKEKALDTSGVTDEDLDVSAKVTKKIKEALD